MKEPLEPAAAVSGPGPSEGPVQLLLRSRILDSTKVEVRDKLLLVPSILEFTKEKLLFVAAATWTPVLARA